MKYLIVHCNPGNGWLDTKITPYDFIDGYTAKLEDKTGIALSETPIIGDFGQIISYFLNLSNNEWDMKQLKCTLIYTYNSYKLETTDEEMMDIEGNIVIGPVTREVIDETFPIISLKIKDKPKNIENRERSYFVESTSLPESIETNIINIWNYFFPNT